MNLSSVVQGRQVRTLIGRAGWNVGDQLVSSGTNLLLSVLVARALTADGFGAFAVAFTVYTFLVSAARALISQPLVVRYTAGSPESFRTAARSAAGGATNLGIVGGVVSVAVGLAVGGTVGASLVCIGTLLPGLLLQDMWRQVFVAEGRPAAAFLNDVVWGIVQLAAVAAFTVLGWQSASAMLLGWGGAALVAALLGIVQFRGGPHLRASLGWLARQRDLLGYYAAAFLAMMGANQITMLLIAGLGEPADVGALRAAQVVLGPLNIAGYSLLAFAMPELSRRRLRGRAAVRAALALSGVMLLADAVWAAVLLMIPDDLGVTLLGDTWASAQAVLPAAFLGLVGIALGFGASTVLLAHGFAKESFWISCLLGPGFLVFGLAGLHFGDAPGAAAGLSLAQWFVVPVTWWWMIVLLRRESRSAADDVPLTS